MSAFPYKTQAVRDLAWACFSPPLLHAATAAVPGAAHQDVANCGLHLTPERQRWLAQLDCQPQPLLTHLAQGTSQRLGIYFERLWHFFLEQDPAVTLVAHNLAVREQGRTLGEFDILYWCHDRQRHFHLELAVKFFLGRRRQTTSEAASHASEWLGPNSADRLDLKLAQLFQRQIRLGEAPVARQQLAQLGIVRPALEIVVKGYLFAARSDPLPAPPGYNPALVLARWLPLNELGQHLKTLPTRRFMLLPKERWLTPVQGVGGERIYHRASLVQQLQSVFLTHSRARLVAALDNEEREQCRFFVTPDNWPLHHSEAPNISERE